MKKRTGLYDEQHWQELHKQALLPTELFVQVVVPPKKCQIYIIWANKSISSYLCYRHNYIGSKFMSIDVSPSYYV